MSSKSSKPSSNRDCEEVIELSEDDNNNVKDTISSSSGKSKEKKEQNKLSNKKSSNAKEKEDSASTLNRSDIDALSAPEQTSHTWVIESFTGPTRCEFCGDLLWGLRRQGVRCKVCKRVSHHRCKEQADKKVMCTNHAAHSVSTVSSDDGVEDETWYVAANDHLGQDVIIPRHHNLQKTNFWTSVHCNVCRARIRGNPAYQCQCCRAVAHNHCKHGLSAAVACRPVSLSPDAKVHTHHWVEGNAKRRCLVCSQSCGHTLALVDFKCSWCELMVHTACMEKMNEKHNTCTRGDLRAAIVPPQWLQLKTAPSIDEDDNNSTATHTQATPSKSSTMFDTAHFEVHASGVTHFRPIVVFINPRSGGQQGKELFGKFQRYLNPMQVFDLTHGGPVPGITFFKDCPTAIMLACGGDGTIGWVLSAMDEVFGTQQQHRPMVAPLPLGTANDMARVLGWGGGYTGESISELLYALSKSRVSMLDRWKVVTTHFDSVKRVQSESDGENAPEEEQERKDKSNKSNNKKKKKKKKKKKDTDEEEEDKYKVVNNYFSVGGDASVALEFHRKREEHPHLFTSRTKNKLWYMNFSLKEMVSSKKALCERIKVEVDGRVIDIGKAEVLLVCNLQSYTGGVNAWGTNKGKFECASQSDMLLEVMGIGGVFQMGLMQIRATKATRLAQGSAIKVTWRDEDAMAVQLDGEPWLERPCEIKISLLNQVPMAGRLGYRKSDRERLEADRKSGKHVHTPEEVQDVDSLSDSEEEERHQLQKHQSQRVTSLADSESTSIAQ